MLNKFIKIFWMLWLAFLTNINIASAEVINNSDYGIKFYHKALVETVEQHKDFDFWAIGNYYQPRFQWFWVIPLDKYPGEWIKFSPVSLSKENIHKTMSNNIETFIAEWNKNTQLYGDYIATCDATYKEIEKFGPMVGWNMLMEMNNNSINLSKEDYMRVVACYVKEKHKISQEIGTWLLAYRKHNIWTAMKQFNNMVWKNWENLSMYNNIFNGKAKYVNWLALRVNGKKVEEFSVYGGGTCWASSIFYQNALKTYGIEIVKRQAHSNFYTSYYGNTIGLDATIFWSANGTPAIDLVMKNNTGINLYMTTYDWNNRYKYFYWVNFYAPFIQQNKIKAENEKVKWNNCYKNTITSPDGSKRYVTSCYKNVYK